VLDVRLFNSSYVEALLALRSGRARQESEPFNEAAGETLPTGSSVRRLAHSGVEFSPVGVRRSRVRSSKCSPALT